MRRFLVAATLDRHAEMPVRRFHIDVTLGIGVPLAVVVIVAAAPPVRMAFNNEPPMPVPVVPALMVVDVVTVRHNRDRPTMAAGHGQRQHARQENSNHDFLLE